MEEEEEELYIELHKDEVTIGECIEDEEISGSF